MARFVAPSDARSLGLPVRLSQEIVSGAHGGALGVTLRRVEIAVASPDSPARGAHHHADFEECIYVLAGRGTTFAGDREYPLAAGDTILIPPREPHVTRNTGDTPLVLLCFFPVADVARGTQEPGAGVLPPKS